MNKSDSIFQYTDGDLTSQMCRMYKNKQGTKTLGLFLGALLYVFLAGCGGGGGGDDARTPATGGGGDDPRTPAITVTSPDDNPPTFIEQTIDEQNYIEGREIMPLDLPEAISGNGALSYSIIGVPPFGLTFDPVNRILSGRPSGTGTVTVIYKVVDGDDNTRLTDEDRIPFTIKVAAGDTVPEFSGTINEQNYIEGIEITPLDLPEATGGTGERSYSIEPESPFGLRFDPLTLTLSGTPSGTGTQMVTYTVVDENENTQAMDENTLTFMITVAADTAPVFVSGTIDDQNYMEGITIPPLVLPEATGGNGVLSYSIIGSPPFGLTFDPVNRILSGTPLGAGGVTLTYKVVDGDENTQAMDENLLTFMITVAADTLPESSGDDQSYIEGITIPPLVLPEATGETGGRSYSIEPESPFSLTFDPLNRILSGTPSGIGTVRVRYKAGDEDIFTFRITVVEDTAPKFSGTIGDLNLLEGVAVSYAASSVTGGNGALSHSMIPESPFGLTLNPFNGILSGTPSGTGTVTVTYTVSDADENTQATDEASFTFRINVIVDGVRPFFTTEEIADRVYIQGRPSISALPVTLPEARGGDGEFLYRLYPLPDGMTFDSGTRELSGSPTILGTTTLTYRVVDLDYDGHGWRHLYFKVINGTFQSKDICGRTSQVRDTILAQIREIINPAITCDLVAELHLASITELDLEGTGITSLQADDFDDLSGLTRLYLTSNSLDTLPENLFDDLSSLEVLSLGSNNLETLPENLLDGPSGLKEIYIFNNDLETLPENLFQRFSTLTHISLYDNNLETLPENLFDGLSNLRRVSLLGNDLETLPENLFEGVTSLEYLDLHENKLETLPENLFNGLSNLISIRLYRNSLETLPENLFDGLSSLTYLTLSNNNLKTLPEDIFNGLSSLKSVNLHNNKLETLPGDIFDRLSNLRVVRLSSQGQGFNRLETIPADMFDGLSNLEELSLDHNPLSSNFPADMFDGLSNLEELGLNNTGQNNPSANLFNGLTNLKELRLGGNGMSSPPEDLFNGLTSLEELTLSYNGIVTPPTGLFNGLTSLTDLDMRGNVIVTLPAGLFNGLSSLTDLNLSCNMITTQPSGLSPSVTLNLRGNPVDGRPFPCPYR